MVLIFLMQIQSYPRHAYGQEHLMPAGSLRKKKLAKRPGYMRPETQRQIEFQSLGACKPFSPEELKNGRQYCGDFENCSLRRPCQSNFEFLRCSAASSAIAPANGVTTLATTGKMSGCCKNLSCCKSPRSENAVIAVYPAAATSKGSVSAACCTWQKSHNAKVSKPPNMYALDQTEVNNNCEYQNRDVVSHSVGAHDSFSSSFSFIQLSLNSAAGVSDAEGKSTVKEAEYVLHPSTTGNLHKPEEMARTREHLGALHCFSRPSEDLEYENETTANDKLQDCETVSLSDTDATFSYSTDSSDAASAGSSVTSGYESSFTVSDHNWDTLMKKYEPVLQDCLLGNRSTLKIKSLVLRLQRLQEKAIEEDDYDRADKFRRKLEELEKEKKSLKFQLPSRHPSVSSFLDRFIMQVQAALRWAADHRVRREETQLWHENEHKLLRSTYQERMQVLATKRNQLFQEKKWLQKEIEDLRARLAILEAKDQQLRREIEEQDRLIQSQDCELTALLSCISLKELEEISKAVDDTLASSYQIPFSLDLPGTIKSLQEKEQSFSMSIKETTAKVCTSQKLCSTLRRKVSDIETQLPALLEAKMLAVSGNNFSTAKDLTEEIRSLTSEKEGLEGLLNELLVLSARNVQKLERIKDDYTRLKQELEQGEAAFVTSVKENAEKYMEMLEDKLHSCGSQLLQRVWEADLEACQLLIRGFQLKETSCCVFEEEENQMDELEMSADGPSDSEKRREGHFPKGTERSTVPCSKHSELKEVMEDISFGAEGHLSEEFFIFSAELGEKCEAISEKLVHLEDQLQTSACRVDEGLAQSLQREIQVVKETLQTMLVQLQPAGEAGEEKAGTSSVTAGVPENKT
ncbi:PREDICTED: LOW QUALITY PROTEIN: disrupted in schizophrenia 1 protein [Haliaeetus leucocephalus]|uniref:LOW QUALITY PROTEIN: disrupted in schizophrenia 1 protein n=1 Tax=Haliaeetus leucocephalus TaxID=52644 RepID=UPI00053CDF8E|nr:PREDICTED: LOW QUALITY PROTEIN: disrupted in schizophrenia 1 protein [Haliaeetus leucocephalus]